LPTFSQFFPISCYRYSISCSSTNNPSGPLLKGANGKPIPTWGFITETVQFQCKMFTPVFCKQLLLGPILGIDFLRKFRVAVAPETSQILFACTAVAPPPKLVLPTFAQFPAAPPAQPGPQDTSPFSCTAGPSLSGKHVQF
jgi:hypothetical protein